MALSFSATKTTQARRRRFKNLNLQNSQLNNNHCELESELSTSTSTTDVDLLSSICCHCTTTNNNNNRAMEPCLCSGNGSHNPAEASEDRSNSPPHQYHHRRRYHRSYLCQLIELLNTNMNTNCSNTSKHKSLSLIKSIFLPESSMASTSNDHHNIRHTVAKVNEPCSTTVQLPIIVANTVASASASAAKNKSSPNHHHKVTTTTKSSSLSPNFNSVNQNSAMLSKQRDVVAVVDDDSLRLCSIGEQQHRPNQISHRNSRSHRTIKTSKNKSPTLSQSSSVINNNPVDIDSSPDSTDCSCTLISSSSMSGSCLSPSPSPLFSSARLSPSTTTTNSTSLDQCNIVTSPSSVLSSNRSRPYPLPPSSSSSTCSPSPSTPSSSSSTISPSISPRLRPSSSPSLPSPSPSSSATLLIESILSSSNARICSILKRFPSSQSLLITLLLLFSFMLHTADSCSSRSTPKPRPPTPTTRPNITFQTYKCPEAYAKWYCLNGATCFSVRIGESILYNCECSDGYMGQRCEFKDLDGSYLPSREKILVETAGIAGGVTLAVLLVVVISLSYYTYLRKQMRTKLLDSSSSSPSIVQGSPYCDHSYYQSNLSVHHSSSSIKNLSSPFCYSASQSYHRYSPSMSDRHYNQTQQQQQPQHGDYSTFSNVISPSAAKQPVSYGSTTIAATATIEPKTVLNHHDDDDVHRHFGNLSQYSQAMATRLSKHKLPSSGNTPPIHPIHPPPPPSSIAQSNNGQNNNQPQRKTSSNLLLLDLEHGNGIAPPPPPPQHYGSFANSSRNIKIYDDYEEDEDNFDNQKQSLLLTKQNKQKNHLKFNC